MTEERNDRGRNARWRRLAAVGVLVLLPLALRLVSIDHGLPRSYVPDTHMVKNALGMARDKDPFPPVGRYSTYPYLVPYLLLPLYGVQYAVGRATGEWGGAQEFGTRAMLEPERVQLTARVLVAVLGALTTWVIYRTARAAGLGFGAWAAAWLVATSLLHVQFSTHERPWVPMLFFGALALWPAVRYASDPRRVWLVWSGLAAGAAFACHQAGLVMAGAAALAWSTALPSSTGWRARALARRLVDGLASVVAFAVVAFTLGHSYYLIHGGVDPEAIAGGEAAQELVSVGGQAVRFGISFDSFAHLTHAFLGYEPALVVLGLIGILPALGNPRTRALTLLALGYAAFFLTNPNDHVRYLLPLAVLLAVPAGLAAERLWAHRAGRAAVVALGLLALVQAVRFDWLLARTDTRALGEERLTAFAAAHPDARFAIDHYGPVVDLTQAALERLAEVRAASTGSADLRLREAKRYEFLRAGWLEPGGLDAIAVDELCGFDPLTREYGPHASLLAHGATCAALLDWAGATHLLLVDRRPGDSEPPWLADLVADREPLWTIDPTAEPSDGPAPEALLPTDMDFPLTGLWQVERPGPWMGLYALQ